MSSPLRTGQPSAGKMSSEGWASATGVALAIGAALPLLVGLPQLTPVTPATVVFTLLMLVAALRLAALIGIAELRLVELTFWTFVYVWCGIAALAQATTGVFYWPGVYQSAEIDVAAYLTALGVGSWLLGYRWSSRRPSSVAQREFSHRRIVTLGVVGVVFTVVALVVLGAETFFVSRDTATRVFESFGGDSARALLIRAAVVVPSTLSLYLLLVRRGRRGVRYSFHTRLLVAALLVAAVVVANPFSNARLLFGSIGIAFAAAVIRPATPSSTRAFMLTIVLGVILIFPVADAFRRDTAQIDRMRFDAELLLHGDYDMAQGTMNAVRFVDDEGHTRGRTMLGTAAFWVPRDIWPSKPEPSSIMVSTQRGYTFTNLAMPAWMDGYLDFGLVGAVLVAGTMGAIGARIDRAALIDLSSPLGSLAPMFAAYQVVMLRGSLMSVISWIALWSALLYLCTTRAGAAASSTPETIDVAATPGAHT